MSKYQQAMKDLELWYHPTTEPTQRAQALESLSIIFDALRDKQAQEKPQPLSLEQLKRTDMDWVWVVRLGDYPHSVAKYINGYGFVIVKNNHVKVVEKNYSLDDYGKTWLAFESNPEPPKQSEQTEED